MMGRAEVTNTFNVDLYKSVEVMKQQCCGNTNTKEKDSKQNDPTAAGLSTKEEERKVCRSVVHFIRDSSSSFKPFSIIPKK